ncbi:MAG: ABC transporter permease, partial [Streptosporangiaceae bacterium]
DLAALTGDANTTLTLQGQPVQISASGVSANLFQLLGVTPALGGGFAPGVNAPAQDGVAILSDALWRQRFGARRDVLGQVVRLGGADRRIVAVMPTGFHFPSASTQAWYPVRMDPNSYREYWTTYSLNLVGRMRPGVSLAQARQEMREQAAAVAGTFPYPIPKTWGSLYPLVTLRDALVGSVQTQFLLLLGAVGLVLLIACVNVVNLLLIDQAGRRREFALRLALGASRWRLTRQVVGGTLKLALLGGGLGLLLAVWGVPILIGAMPGDTPNLAAAGLHWRALGFAAVLTLAVGVVTGLLPGWRAGSLNLEAALRSGGSSAGIPRARQRLSAGLLIGEVAIAVVVTVAGALLSASLIRLSRANPGFQSAGVATMQVAPADAYCAAHATCANFYRLLQANVAALPGVQAAAFTNAVPLSGAVPIAPAIFQDHPLLPGGEVPLVWANLVTPGYLRALGIHLLAGRDLG